MKTFIDLKDLSVDQVRGLLHLANELEGKRAPEVLEGKTVGLLFMNPSLRTLASMQVAIQHLGGHSVVIQPGVGSWVLELRDGAVMDGAAVEHVREAIPVLASYFDVLGIRCFAEGRDLETDLADQTIHKMESLCRVPMMNLESAAAHPCQALADWKTLDDLEIPTDGRFVLSWAFHPKPLPFAVPLSALTMALMRGMEVAVLRPPGFDLPQTILNRAEEAATKGGGRFFETEHREEALDGATVLYCKSWAKPDLYGQVEADQAYRQAFRDWTVDEPWFSNAKPDAKFMHCLPVRRNVKVTDAVLDGPRSVVLRQAENRLHVQKAVLAALQQDQQGA